MKTINSQLEDNIFSGVLVKKGKHLITEREYRTLITDVNFCTFIEQRKIKLEGQKNTYRSEKPDFDAMNYQELKAYVKLHNIKTNSDKKADILKALKGE